MRGIHKSWKDLKVLDDVDLTLDRGSIISITGTNGIGKTTLLRIAVGLIMPDEGSVVLDGLHPIRDRREFQTLTGFLAAGDRGLYGRLTLRQHLDLWGKISMLSKKEIREGIDRLVPALGLEDFLDRRANRMSMGQRQRLRLSMVFLHEPTFVLLDEPLNSLDNVGGELLAVQLAELTARGGAAIWCSPGTDAPPVTFDRRLRLEAGHLVEV